MRGYLETYGAGEAQRARRWRRVGLVALLALLLAGSLYYFFRNYRETKRVALFFTLLRAKDYKAAYALWGCTDATPCPNYDMSKFLEDWGPNGLHADLGQLQITKVKGCSPGVIVESNFGKGSIEYLWVDRRTREIGYAPFSVCNPVYRPNAGKGN